MNQILLNTMCSMVLMLGGMFDCTSRQELGDVGKVDLRVLLRTDMQPLVEFSGLEVTVDGKTMQMAVRHDGTYARPGEEVAIFENLKPTVSRDVEMKLILAGDVVKKSVVRIEHKRDLVLTISITRSCDDIQCGDVNGVPQRCLGGSCVDAGCVTGQEPSCPEPQCTTDAECATASTCTVPACVDGVCFSRVEPNLCQSGEICDFELGCIGDHVQLEVFLRTDYEPVREFSSIEVLVDGLPASTLATLDGSYVTPGQAVALFENLTASAKRTVQVSLIKTGGGVLDSTTVEVDHNKNTRLTVAMTRNCESVVCGDVGGNAQRCLAGVCQDAGCAAGDEQICIGECTLDEDCPQDLSCASTVCVQGLCFYDLDNHTCPENKVCAADGGYCVDP